jgi:hypothetical protein
MRHEHAGVADIRMPVVEALRLHELLSKLPKSFSSNGANGFSVTDELMPQLAQLTKVHGIVLEGNELVVQCATDTLEWADIALPVEEALKLHEEIWTLMNSFSPNGKKGEHVIRFPRPVKFESILEISSQSLHASSEYRRTRATRARRNGERDDASGRR